MSKSNATIRYTDAELQEFKALVEKKLAKAKEQLDALQAQIMENTENSGDEHGVDWSDDSTFNNQMEMLNNMAIRQRKYIQDLQNALIRIQNKTYGVCMITGQLIDKKRLMAVPTTTKSLAAKQDLQNSALNRPRSNRSIPAGKSAAPKPASKKKKPATSDKTIGLDLELEDEEQVETPDIDIEEEAVDRAKKDFEDLNSEED